MTAAALIEHLRAQGVTLTASDGQLRLHGPREVLTPVVIEALRARKSELLAALIEVDHEVDHSLEHDQDDQLRAVVQLSLPAVLQHSDTEMGLEAQRCSGEATMRQRA